MKTRKLILDTETTGLNPRDGDRIVEIACIEIVDGQLTENIYHQYINPMRESSPEALRAHGLTPDFLADKPLFSDIAYSFLDFIQGAELIIHNAPFDVSFINKELSTLAEKPLQEHCYAITDTLKLARLTLSKKTIISALIESDYLRELPLVKAMTADQVSKEMIIDRLSNGFHVKCYSLDTLCHYYGVDVEKRKEHHGALIDCELLAAVFFHLKQAKPFHASMFKPQTTITTPTSVEPPSQLKL